MLNSQELLDQISKDNYRKSTRHKRMSGQTILYSDHTTLCHGRGETITEIIELDPQSRTVFWRERPNKENHYIGKITKFYLPMPYVVFGCRCCKYNDDIQSDLWVLFSNKPSKSIHDNLFFPPLTNINKNVKVCMSKPCYKNSQTMISAFWQTPFTFDGVTPALLHPGMMDLEKLGGFEGWAEIKNPLETEWSSGWSFTMAGVLENQGVKLNHTEKLKN